MESDSLDLPAIGTVDRLLRWHEKRAAIDGRLALSLEAEGLDIAAETNRQRSLVHRQTANCLRVLRERCYAPEASEAPTHAFRGHLTTKSRPRPQVRAPP